jgi:ATP-binding cassette subfamily C (CFTR/MRP) protein 1
MAPAATFGAYAIQAMVQGSDSLSTVQVFTSLALITLVSYPATRLLAAAPNLAASIGCFDRIQEYLLAESRVDGRVGSGKSLLDMTASATGENPTICLKNASIRPAPEAGIVLENVSLSITQGSLVMITGPVGVGKTTLLKAILGELPCDEGSISVELRRMAYCAQSPWLQNGTIRQAICGVEGGNPSDEIWYETVLEACALSHDIAKLPFGDGSVIGSRGATLSGGQRHRVALARALYSRAKVVLLDDILSALDEKTQKFVADRLFGSKGIFSRLEATVVLVTHASKSKYSILL